MHCPQQVLPTDWQQVDFISDLHLHSSQAATAQGLYTHLSQTPADALCILGDLFEVWIGDDCLQADDPESRFQQGVCRALHRFAQSKALYVMRGNRDFLLGEGFAQASGATLIDDPTLWCWRGQKALLSHGDAWCLDDTRYQSFRAQVRQLGWQQAFLARPLAERSAQARQMRAHSETQKRTEGVWSDLDLPTVDRWLQACAAETLVHGHTHQAQHQSLGAGRQRWVLSDWDGNAQPVRGTVLSWHQGRHWQTRPVWPRP